MRLRPSLGQLRLQRELDDLEKFPPEVKLSVEPEQLRASVSIEATGAYAAGGSDLVYLELSFPPQYPHRPPRISQITPDGCLPFWRYEGQFVLLERLSERGWSSVMGVTDIVKDLLQPLGLAGSGWVNTFPMSSLAPELGDVEMV
jgi:ubiquitin-protein ligase